jgi:hypothetical protein
VGPGQTAPAAAPPPLDEPESIDVLLVPESSSLPLEPASSEEPLPASSLALELLPFEPVPVPVLLVLPPPLPLVPLPDDFCPPVEVCVDVERGADGSSPEHAMSAPSAVVARTHPNVVRVNLMRRAHRTRNAKAIIHAAGAAGFAARAVSSPCFFRAHVLKHRSGSPEGRKWCAAEPLGRAPMSLARDRTAKTGYEGPFASNPRGFPQGRRA